MSVHLLKIRRKRDAWRRNTVSDHQFGSYLDMDLIPYSGVQNMCQKGWTAFYQDRMNIPFGEVGKDKRPIGPVTIDDGLICSGFIG